MQRRPKFLRDKKFRHPRRSSATSAMEQRCPKSRRPPPKPEGSLNDHGHSENECFGPDGAARGPNHPAAVARHWRDRCRCFRRWRFPCSRQFLFRLPHWLYVLALSFAWMHGHPDALPLGRRRVGHRDPPHPRVGHDDAAPHVRPLYSDFAAPPQALFLGSPRSTSRSKDRPEDPGDRAQLSQLERHPAALHSLFRDLVRNGVFPESMVHRTGLDCEPEYAAFPRAELDRARRLLADDFVCCHRLGDVVASALDLDYLRTALRRG